MIGINKEAPFVLQVKRLQVFIDEKMFRYLSKWGPLICAKKNPKLFLR